jgi:hypothetical protein
MKTNQIFGQNEEDTVMRRIVVIITIMVVSLSGCALQCNTQTSGEGNEKEYSSTEISLSDFSMTIVGYYEKKNLSIPKDFDTKQFFDVLEKKYPDKSRIKHVKENYFVSVRPLDGGYSVMLCDPKTNQKIMEDLSCHLDFVEIHSWRSNADRQCIFEKDWKSYCE